MEIDVPIWNEYYPSLKEATRPQKQFYKIWVESLKENKFIDTGSNISYISVYAYSLIEEYLKKGNLKDIIDRFERLLNFYIENIKACQYIYFWLSDLYLLGKNYDKSWELKRKVSLTIENVVHLRSKCADTTINGSDLLMILKSGTGLTRIGKDNVGPIEKLATLLLKDFHIQYGFNIVDYFLKQIDYANLSETDFTNLKNFYAREAQFIMWKEDYLRNRSKYPYIYNHYLFSGMPIENKPFVRLSAIPYVVSVAIENELKRILREAENTIREENNLPKVGEGWVSETELFNILTNAFPNELVLPHGRPYWLNRQHLDIYFPQRNIGVEYQGAQHLFPVEFFGGKESFERQKKLDFQKSQLCKKNGCYLICVYENYNIDEVVSLIETEINNQNKINDTNYSLE